MIQLAAGIAQNEKRRTLTREDIEWVVNSTQHNPRPEIKPPAKPQVGYVNGLAVYGPNMGTLIEVEATTMPVRPGQGKVSITGIIEEEEMGRVGHTIRRRGAAKDAAENVITVLSHLMRINLKDYDIHLNFPGGIPVDGPSAGVAMATAIYSSLTNSPVDSLAAMTENCRCGANPAVGGLSPRSMPPWRRDQEDPLPKRTTRRVTPTIIRCSSFPSGTWNRSSGSNHQDRKAAWAPLRAPKTRIKKGNIEREANSTKPWTSRFLI